VFYVTEDSAVETSGQPRSDWRRVRAYWDGSDVVCTFDNENGDSGQLTYGGSELFTNMNGWGGLRVYNEGVSFRAFVLYQ